MENSILNQIKEDYIFTPNKGSLIHTYWSSKSFRITFWFRLGGSKLISRFARTILHRIILGENVLELHTQIGKGFFLAHPIGIVINDEAIIGDYVWVYQNVTIAKMYGKGAPIIGNNVLLFAGAKIIGNVKIGDNVVIGANAVVTHDIPDNAIAVGIPAKVINYNGKEINKMYKPFI